MTTSKHGGRESFRVRTEDIDEITLAVDTVANKKKTPCEKVLHV